MPSPIIRTFLGFQVPPALRPRFAEWQKLAGQAGRALDPALLHLTLCVIGENVQRDLFLARRAIAALGADVPPSAPIRFGRVHGRAMGAELVTRGSKAEIREFYDAIVRPISACGSDPLHRLSGLRPHITLGYDRVRFDPFDVDLHWIPDEMLLIESRPSADGSRREHEVLHRWPLLPPAQGVLPFDRPAPLRRAA